MNRFDISLFGFRLIARGQVGIAGALLVVAMLVGLAVASSLIALLADGGAVLPPTTRAVQLPQLQQGFSR
ncbi:hypothetical protein ACFFTN_21505 [Aminobacter aganoensis]|uniref:Uncharacterized protein n=1 Tax=Aminobacter aganoensis TaxID=83264 RepID=A0A7X0KNG5_9HYPH|nr:hypothetical protein [Aminobacter aganoensis]MBB6357136.1 hypothetical protein [Aminobacter aganoensis]